MLDVLFVLVLVALFAVTAGVVRMCDRMIGADDDIAPAAPASPVDTEPVAA